MGSFSLNFPDTAILNLLGDEALLIHAYGGSELIQGEFDWKYLGEELGELIDISYPVFDCLDSVALRIKNDSILEFDGKQYTVFKKRPIDTGKKQIILKLLR